MQVFVIIDGHRLSMSLIINENHRFSLITNVTSHTKTYTNGFVFNGKKPTANGQVVNSFSDSFSSFSNNSNRLQFFFQGFVVFPMFQRVAEWLFFYGLTVLVDFQCFQCCWWFPTLARRQKQTRFFMESTHTRIKQKINITSVSLIKMKMRAGWKTSPCPPVQEECSHISDECILKSICPMGRVEFAQKMLFSTEV